MLVNAEQQWVRGCRGALSAGAVRWLETGDRGTSSETIFTVLTGLHLINEEEMSHPLDAWDFRRCCLLLDSCPELAKRFDNMRAVSTEWDALIGAWYSIFALMDSENPHWRDRVGTLIRTHQRISDVLIGIADPTQNAKLEER
ncbi:hypothetical protein CRM94_17315 [Burkholderia gladioli]|uniref:Uncharacterized protein n=1 Tax=Burkholderia gladioli TaxID=28095 RepID=A0A2A7SAL2_BURGA|nr:hypothetical protein [Burkholderia gladioli]PEH40512.1 hypothetical protein CRM94_17315 [Burkholderia gladioli]